MATTRRVTLVGTAIAGTTFLAGCSSILGGNPDVVVFNRTDSELRADITLVDTDGEELLSKRAAIEPDNAFEHDEVLSSGTYTLSVDVEGGPSGEREFDVEDGDSLQARVDEDDIEFNKL
ncbi:MAG: hypothetical protein ACQEP0_15535 [Natrinema limicola]